MLHARRAEAEGFVGGQAGWFDGVCVFCQGGVASQRVGTTPWRSVRAESSAVRIEFDSSGREGRDSAPDAGFGELRQGLRTRSAALRTTDYIVREQIARPDTVSMLLGAQPGRLQRSPAQISAAAAIQQAGQRMRREERAEAEAAASAAEVAAAKAAEEAASTKRQLQSAEEAMDRMVASLAAERRAREVLEDEVAEEQAARAAAQAMETEWRRRYEEELGKRKAADAARDSAVVERDSAQELMEIAEEDAKRARGLWVASAWKAAWDRKQRDQARAEAAAATEKAARAEAASAADREARATAEGLARIDKHEREEAAARALIDRQAREVAERRATDEANARALLAETCARAVADAKNAQMANAVAPPQASSSTWQIAMLRTQLDVLRSTRESLEKRLAEFGEAREQAERRLGEAVARTAAAEARMERAEDDAAAARAELAPLAVAAAEARAAAASAELARQEEMERRMAAENERRRRIDRVRRNRERQSVGFSPAADSSSESMVAKARRKKLEKNVSTYLAAR